MVTWIKNWFSNFEEMDEPIIKEGILYKTVENFYQAMKNKDDDYRIKVSKVPAYQAKKLGKGIKLRDDWEDIKFAAMWGAIQWKYKKGTSHYRKLIATDPWDIVEWNNWHDNFWGVCICDKCKDIIGKNKLGMMMMKLRTIKLREIKK